MLLGITLFDKMSYIEVDKRIIFNLLHWIFELYWLLFLDILVRDPIFTCSFLQLSWSEPRNKYFVWEICFAVFISISTVVLFSFLFGNKQVGFEHSHVVVACDDVNTRFSGIPHYYFFFE